MRAVVVRTIIPERIDFFSCTLRAGFAFSLALVGDISKLV